MIEVGDLQLQFHNGLARRETCRLCGSRDLARVVALTPTPPANAFVGMEAKQNTQREFPLDLYFCKSCHHVQLLDVVDPEVLFRDYVYVSGTSPTFVQHFNDYAKTVTSSFGLSADTLVVDIGSNDGTLLRQFKNLGHRVLGVDPARSIAAEATKNGIPTIANFFDPDLAATIREQHGPAQVVTANNVFAHADDLSAITTGIAGLLAPDGVFVFEVSYLLDVIDQLLFDTVYHEHLAYHSVGPLRNFFESHGMRLFRTDRVNTHGGSLRGYVCLADAPHPNEQSVQSLLDAEAKSCLDDPQTLQDFSKRIDARGREVLDLLKDLKTKGKRIAGFGAPAKATTLMYHFGIGPELIDYIIDDSPLKQGLYSPGMHIPVVDSSYLYGDDAPDYTVILAWNFAAPIRANHQTYIDNGGHFIVPLPELEINPS